MGGTNVPNSLHGFPPPVDARVIRLRNHSRRAPLKVVLDTLVSAYSSHYSQEQRALLNAIHLSADNLLLEPNYLNNFQETCHFTTI